MSKLTAGTGSEFKPVTFQLMFTMQIEAELVSWGQIQAGES